MALKHLVPLQARTRPSLQAELDLHTAADKQKVVTCEMRRVPLRGPWTRVLIRLLYCLRIGHLSAATWAFALPCSGPLWGRGGCSHTKEVYRRNVQSDNTPWRYTQRDPVGVRSRRATAAQQIRHSKLLFVLRQLTQRSCRLRMGNKYFFLFYFLQRERR